MRLLFLPPTLFSSYPKGIQKEVAHIVYNSTIPSHTGLAPSFLFFIAPSLPQHTSKKKPHILCTLAILSGFAPKGELLPAPERNKDNHAFTITSHTGLEGEAGAVLFAELATAGAGVALGVAEAFVNT